MNKVLTMAVAFGLATTVIGQTGTKLRVANMVELGRAMQAAKPGDVIEMTDGDWVDAHIEFDANATADRPVTLRAQTPGRVVLSGTSYLQLVTPHLIVDGLYFTRTTPVDTKNPVVEFRSHHGKVVNTAIDNYNPPEFGTRYHWMRFSGERNIVERCYFAGKNHQGPVIALGDDARHNTVRYSHFESIPHAPPNGREIIQASGYGSSEELGDDGGFMTIEHNLFERADGEGAEIVSLKSNRNVVRFNTIRETIGAIVGRSGNYNTIEGNIILGENRKGTAGIRVSGQHHKVVDNYIAGVAEAALNLYAGEYFVDERGEITKLTPEFAPIFRKNTQYGAVPAYGHVKHGVYTGNVFVSNAGPEIVIGGLYRSGWPARQRVLLPEENRIANNTIYHQRQGGAEIREQQPDLAPPLDRLKFRKNTIEANTILTSGAAPRPPRRPLTKADVGPAWRK
jgi:poly(beta-D-mannuronate) lyase